MGAAVKVIDQEGNVVSAVGRPSLFTPELANKICVALASGLSLSAICREPGMPSRVTVGKWLLNPGDDPAKREFLINYAQARELQADGFVDEMLAVAYDDSQDERIGPDGEVIGCNNEFVQRSRLKVDTLKWIAARMAPKKYGDRLALAGDATAPINLIVSNVDNEL